MYKSYFIANILLFLVIVTFLTACSSTIYIENHKFPNGSLENIDLNELNSNSQNVIDQFINSVGSNSKKKNFLYEAADYINIPYQFGGESKEGIDCSGFTQAVYKKSLSVQLPRTAREQFQIGEKIGSKSDLKFGDLVYFDTSNINFPGHVGIVVDKDLFIHASSSKGVIISSLNNTYYAKKYIGATRIKVNWSSQGKVDSFFNAATLLANQFFIKPLGLKFPR